MVQEGLRLFYSYSHADEGFRSQLEKHLAILRRKGSIRDWSDRRIAPGAEWKEEIDNALEAADIILLLVSADFLASDYCYDVELERALARHKKGDALVVPIIIRPVDLEDSPLAGLQALPTNAKAVTTWDNRDEAWLNVARGIRIACSNIQELKRGSTTEKADSATQALLEEKKADFGILDFSAELEVAMQVAIDCQNAITKHTEEVTEALQSGTTRALQLKSSTMPGKATRLRQIAGSMAAALAAYAKKIENTASELEESWDRVDEFLPKLLELSDVEKEREHVPELRTTILGAMDSVEGARESAMGAAESLAELAKLSAALKIGANRAKKGIQAVVEQYWRIENSMRQTLSRLDDLFGMSD